MRRTRGSLSGSTGTRQATSAGGTRSRTAGKSRTQSRRQYETCKIPSRIQRREPTAWLGSTQWCRSGKRARRLSRSLLRRRRRGRMLGRIRSTFASSLRSKLRGTARPENRWKRRGKIFGGRSHLVRGAASPRALAGQWARCWQPCANRTSSAASVPPTPSHRGQQHRPQKRACPAGTSASLLFCSSKRGVERLLPITGVDRYLQDKRGVGHRQALQAPRRPASRWEGGC
mmetsp:Transcript_17333/g.40430  ORF Transcript_17333/g.40430 Transcript_17333/m.40430 type:complete len:230 (+) Transcript_17333:396-1085(+)